MVFTALSRMLIPSARHLERLLEDSCRLHIKMYGFVWSSLQTYSLRKPGHLSSGWSHAWRERLANIRN